MQHVKNILARPELDLFAKCCNDSNYEVVNLSTIDTLKKYRDNMLEWCPENAYGLFMVKVCKLVDERVNRHALMFSRLSKIKTMSGDSNGMELTFIDADGIMCITPYEARWIKSLAK